MPLGRFEVLEHIEVGMTLGVQRDQFAIEHRAVRQIFQRLGDVAELTR